MKIHSKRNTLYNSYAIYLQSIMEHFSKIDFNDQNKSWYTKILLEAYLLII